MTWYRQERAPPYKFADVERLVFTGRLASAESVIMRVKPDFQWAWDARRRQFEPKGKFSCVAVYDTQNGDPWRQIAPAAQSVAYYLADDLIVVQTRVVTYVSRRTGTSSVCWWYWFFHRAPLAKGSNSLIWHKRDLRSKTVQEAIAAALALVNLEGTA